MLQMQLWRQEMLGLEVRLPPYKTFTCARKSPSNSDSCLQTVRYVTIFVLLTNHNGFFGYPLSNAWLSVWQKKETRCGRLRNRKKFTENIAHRRRGKSHFKKSKIPGQFQILFF